MRMIASRLLTNWPQDHVDHQKMLSTKYTFLNRQIDYTSREQINNGWTNINCVRIACERVGGVDERRYDKRLQMRWAAYWARMMSRQELKNKRWQKKKDQNIRWAWRRLYQEDLISSMAKKSPPRNLEGTIKWLTCMRTWVERIRMHRMGGFWSWRF